MATTAIFLERFYRHRFTGGPDLVTAYTTILWRDIRELGILKMRIDMGIMIKIYGGPPPVRVIVTELRMRARKCREFFLVTRMTLPILKFNQGLVCAFVLCVTTTTISSLVNGCRLSWKGMAVKAL
ncbi:MAG: hypothetical protein VYA17_00405 [Pseudomonadota bacterium]|nr:hypothetical protein [Pseudomonadota bacterium]